MEWFSTKERPQFSNKLKRPNWEGELKANFKCRDIWLWLYHPDEGVRPFLIREMLYDNAGDSWLDVRGQSKFSFVRWKAWAYLEIPEFLDHELCARKEGEG